MLIKWRNMALFTAIWRHKGNLGCLLGKTFLFYFFKLNFENWYNTLVTMHSKKAMSDGISTLTDSFTVKNGISYGLKIT